MTTENKTASKKTASKKTPSNGSVKKVASKKAAAKKSAAKATGKRASLMRQKRSTGSGPACWPGFQRVPGKEAGTKGSCEPKPHQTAGEKKEDAREAAGSKLRRAGGNKAKANRSR